VNLKNVEIIIGIIVASIAAMISIYKLYADSRQNRPKLYVETGWIESSDGNRSFYFCILNHGPRTVHVYQVGYILPLDYDNLPKSIEDELKERAFGRLNVFLSSRYSFLAESGIALRFFVPVSDMYTLKPNERCFVYDDPGHLPKILRKAGYTGECRIIPFCRDITNRTFKAEPFVFDVETLEFR
jgi:hypothetical protein